jgi:predicted ATPase/DNA-binding SARP family transcriptional activator/Tfp pilus assembly protein PilF
LQKRFRNLFVGYNDRVEKLAMDRLSIITFGPPQVFVNDAPVFFDRNKALALLVYLAVEGGVYSRESLAALFWPENDQSRAYAYLRRTIFSINQTIGSGWVEANREAVRLVKNKALYLDVDRFRVLQQKRQQQAHSTQEYCTTNLAFLQEAAHIYQNDFLSGFTLRDSPDFDEWQIFQVEDLRRELGNVLVQLTNCYVYIESFDKAIQTARRCLSINLFHEEYHRMLMLTYAQAGDRSAAIKQFQECANILKSELGLEPEQETVDLLNQIKQGDHPNHRLQRIPEVQAQASPSQLELGLVNLPAPMTPFVGRQSDIDQILTLIRKPECRLLSLVGPGGTGKTRLAIRAVELLYEARDTDPFPIFSQGIYYLSLAPLRSEDDLISTIADSLKVSFQTDVQLNMPYKTPQNQLIDFLREKQLFLILDNFEHLLSQADLLADIITAAPQVKILVTSRERLNLYGEWVLEVSGMTYPPEPGEADQDSISTFSAVELFIQNATRTAANFKILEGDLTHIVTICRLVEGMPLAIELAAAWVKMLTVGEIAQEIRLNLDFLSAHARDIPQRHSSLRLVFEHSWKFLNEGERQGLRRLSVFRGPFSREAAQAVAEVNLPILSALVDKSLLHTQDIPKDSLLGARYQMHELVKQYAAEKLSEDLDDQQKVLDSHSWYYSSLLEELRPALRRAEQFSALKRIEVELDDIRAAWNHALVNGLLDNLQKAFYSLVHYYDLRGWINDLREMMKAGIQHLRSVRDNSSLPNEQIDGLYAQFLAGYSQYTQFTSLNFDEETSKEAFQLLSQLSDTSPWLYAYVMLHFGSGLVEAGEAFELFEKCVTQFHKADDQWGVAISQLTFSGVGRQENDKQLANQLADEALKIFRKLGDRFGVALCLNELGAAAYQQGSYQQAMKYAQEALESYIVLKDRWRIVGSLITLGQVYTALGLYPEAIQRYQDSLEIALEIGNRSLIGVHHDCLGYTYLLMGRHDQSEEHYRHSLSMYLQADNFQGLGMAYNNLGDIARLQGNYHQARRDYNQGLESLGHIKETNSWQMWSYSILNKKLGLVELAEGKSTEAMKRFSRALSYAWEIERSPEVLDVLIGVAELKARDGELEEAKSLVKVVIRHPATSHEVRERAGVLLEEIEAEVGRSEVIDNEAGSTDDLDLVVQKYLSDR